MTIMTTDSFLFRDCTSGVLGHHGDQLGKGSCNPLLVFQLKVLWYQDFTGTFIYESLHYITMLFSRTVSHIPRMCFSEIHVKINITMEGKNTLKKARKLQMIVSIQSRSSFHLIDLKLFREQAMIKQICHKALYIKYLHFKCNQILSTKYGEFPLKVSL